ncbi:hypothetical protein [Streptomyces sp. WMMB 322]|uniref:hypothetical protein n=1 Tax=Streptomyces sp. WMMB 322 TaxID=1286821 RepID=UPI000823DEAA|nr:hypothetical protein [Streptomyces sp. WMMB 322]SCK18496.1 hypothetical protein H180DRAFT_01289 [Streptomyces sp. WMMB 322]
MGPAGPTGPVMSREEADRALERLTAEHEAVESSLLALQDHAGRRLLEGAQLTGTTAGRWARAEEAVTRLWNVFEYYSGALAKAQEVRERRRWPSREDLAELTQLLRGFHTLPGSAAGGAGNPADGVESSAGAVEGPGGGGGGPQPEEEATLSTLVEWMNGWYAQALDVVAAADSVWSALPARIDMLAAELRRVRSLAHSVGVRPGEHPSGDDLERTTEELTSLRAEVVSDPLAFWTPAGGSSAPGGGRPDTSRYDRAARELEDIRREIDAVLNVRQDSEQRLMRLRDVLSRADRTLAEARAARGEVLAKIAASEVPAVSGPATALQEQLSAAAEYRRRSQWHRLSPLLESLEQRAEDELDRARAQLAAVTAPLAVRAELRGRLDAYKAKVAQQGMGEERMLTERYDAARRMLWSAPCDLRAAEDAVRRYQHAAQQVLTASRQDGEGGPARVEGVTDA